VVGLTTELANYWRTNLLKKLEQELGLELDSEKSPAEGDMGCS